jgi:hypothetical protein
VKFTSTLVSAASGSAGGIVASRNRYGQYFRRRSTPVNPNSDRQVATRAALREAVNAWTNILDDDQRAIWDLYASNTPVIGKLGAMNQLSGQNMFVRTYINAIAIGAPASTYYDGPTVYDLGSFTLPSFTVVAGGPLSLTFTATDSWAVAAHGYLGVWLGRPQNPSRAFFKGPWRFLGKVSGAATPPTSPEAFATLPWETQAGQAEWIRVRALQPDGRLSSAAFIGPVIAS